MLTPICAEVFHPQSGSTLEAFLPYSRRRNAGRPPGFLRRCLAGHHVDLHHLLAAVWEGKSLAIHCRPDGGVSRIVVRYSCQSSRPTLADCLR